MEVIAAWFSFLVCFGVRHLPCFFSPLISCRDWQPVTHLHSQMSIARKPAYSSASPSCALITQNNPHPDPVSTEIFKVLGKSKAKQPPFMTVDIAITEGLKSHIPSTLSSWVTPTVQGKAIVSGPGENHVQSPQNDRNMMIRAVFESSSPQNQTGKTTGLPVASHAQGESPCGSFSGQQCLNYFLHTAEYTWIQWIDANQRKQLWVPRLDF